VADSNFSAQVSAWVANSKAAAEAVFHQAAQTVVEEMQKTRAEGGNMPVDTGFLRASLMASNDSMPTMRDPKPANAAAGSFAYSADTVNLVINGTPLGGKVYCGYVANYANYVEMGTSKTPARLFVTLAAQRWPEIVKKAEEELLQRAGGSAS